jgi:hypothetical protein
MMSTGSLPSGQRAARIKSSALWVGDKAATVLKLRSNALAVCCARRAGHKNARRMRQPLVQPSSHAVRLALTFCGERAFEVVLLAVLVRCQLECFSVSPQDEVHELPLCELFKVCCIAASATVER